MWDIRSEDLMDEEDFAPIWSEIIQKARSFGYRPFILLDDFSHQKKDFSIQTIGFMQLRYPMPSDDVWLVRCKVPLQNMDGDSKIHIESEMHLRYTDLELWRQAALRARSEVYRIGGKYDDGWRKNK